MVKKVLSATMHNSVFIPGTGQVGPDVYSYQSGVTKAVDMQLNDQFVTFKSKQTKGKETVAIEVLVPVSNFKHITLEIEENKDK